MRKLEFRDAFTLARIVKAAGVKQEIASFAAEYRDKKAVDLDAVGLEFFVTLVEAAGNSGVEQKIYEFYADLKGTRAEDVAHYSFAVIKEDIGQLIEENDLKSFFSSFSALMSKQ